MKNSCVSTVINDLCLQWKLTEVLIYQTVTLSMCSWRMCESDSAQIVKTKHSHLTL